VPKLRAYLKSIGKTKTARSTGYSLGACYIYPEYQVRVTVYIGHAKGLGYYHIDKLDGFNRIAESEVDQGDLPKNPEDFKKIIFKHKSRQKTAADVADFHTFTTPQLTYDHHAVTNNAIIKTVKCNDIVTIAGNKIESVISDPNTECWFRMECAGNSGHSFWILVQEREQGLVYLFLNIGSLANAGRVTGKLIYDYTNRGGDFRMDYSKMTPQDENITRLAIQQYIKDLK
jgi:hypothetical protein